MWIIENIEIIENILIHCVKKMQRSHCTVPCCMYSTNQRALSLPRALCFLYANWYVRKITAEIVLKILGVTVQNLFSCNLYNSSSEIAIVSYKKTSEHTALVVVFLRYKPQASSLFPYVPILFIKAVLLQAWSGPESSRKLRFPDFMTTAQDGG
jgi:hypothetical protein